MHIAQHSMQQTAFMRPTPAPAFAPTVALAPASPCPANLPNSFCFLTLLCTRPAQAPALAPALNPAPDFAVPHHVSQNVTACTGHLLKPRATSRVVKSCMLQVLECVHEIGIYIANEQAPECADSLSALTYYSARPFSSSPIDCPASSTAQSTFWVDAVFDDEFDPACKDLETASSFNSACTVFEQ